MNPSKGIWGFFGNELRQLFGKFKNHLEIKFKQMKNKKACKKKKRGIKLFSMYKASKF